MEFIWTSIVKTGVRVEFDVSYQETHGQRSGERNDASSGENRGVDAVVSWAADKCRCVQSRFTCLYFVRFHIFVLSIHSQILSYTRRITLYARFLLVFLGSFLKLLILFLHVNA
jgi:hypothetical protein